MNFEEKKEYVLVLPFVGHKLVASTPQHLLVLIFIGLVASTPQYLLVLMFIGHKLVASTPQYLLVQ
jgi:hypothetical protein